MPIHGWLLLFPFFSPKSEEFGRKSCDTPKSTGAFAADLLMPRFSDERLVVSIRMYDCMIYDGYLIRFSLPLNLGLGYDIRRYKLDLVTRVVDKDMRICQQWPV